MENVAVFQNDVFGSLKTVTHDGQPWFVGRDVAEMLGYAHPIRDVIRHVDPEDRIVLKPVDFPQKYQNGTFNIPPRGLTFINESGLYSLILSSHLPEARQFKRWVTSDVLPAIRRHGFYATRETVSQFLADPQAMIELLQQISDERQNLLQTRQQLADTTSELLEAQDKLAHYGPSPIIVSLSDPDHNTSTITDLAEQITADGFPVSRNRLYAYLRHIGLIRPDSCLPTLDAIHRGLFVITERRTSSHTYYATGVTALGRLYFTDFFLGKKLERKEHPYHV